MLIDEKGLKSKAIFAISALLLNVAPNLECFVSSYDFSAQRLVVEADLYPMASLILSREQGNYVLNVLRMSAGHKLLVFNGKDGEWQAEITKADRKLCIITLLAQTRIQPAKSQVSYAFAPLKSARLDYLIQKAVEMGVSRLQPILTRRTQVARLNHQRMRANCIEAAEQCGILTLAEIMPEIKFERFIAQFQQEATMTLVFCDEDAPQGNPLEALRAAKISGPICILVGPEGGFDPAERAMLLNVERTIRLSLGPRILRADTAAVAALALVQASIGDWR